MTEEKKPAKKAAAKKKAVAKDRIVLISGPYQGVEKSLAKSTDFVTHDDGEFGKHRYARSEAVTDDGRVLFEWRGPVE